MKKIETKCTCAFEFKACQSPLYISSKSIKRIPSEMMKCGKYIKLLNELKHSDRGIKKRLNDD